MSSNRCTAKLYQDFKEQVTSCQVLWENKKGA